MRNLVLTYFLLSGMYLAAVHRNPFSYGENYLLFTCIAIGAVNNETYCAYMYDNGTLILLQQNQIYRAYTVERITAQAITLRSPDGTIEHSVLGHLPDRTPRKKAPQLKS